VSRQGGATRIFLYNWPAYVGTWTGATALLVASLLRPAATLVPALVALAAGGALASSLVSLLVSHYIYDRSALASAHWARELLASGTQTWAMIHAGLDAEVDWNAVMPGRCVGRLDIFDPSVMTSRSIGRARVHAPAARAAAACSPKTLALGNDSCDAIGVAFTAHEIRDRQTREAFFDELRRSLCPGGRMVLVEHPRDCANLLAFGPGCLHFLPRREWLRLASRARLVLHSETKITPWITAFAFGKPA
jgi:SAM-dependent methyltransferase